MGVPLPYRANADPINQAIDDFLREFRWHRVYERSEGARRGNEISLGATGHL